MSNHEFEYSTELIKMLNNYYILHMYNILIKKNHLLCTYYLLPIYNFRTAYKL